MRNRSLQIIALFFLLVSAALFLFPNVSKKVLQAKNDAAVEQFDNNCEEMRNGDRLQAIEDGIISDEGYLLDDDGKIVSNYSVVYREDIEMLYEDSVAYNEALKDRQDMDIDFAEAALDLTEYGIYDGIYGFISAPAIGMNLPISLGASEDNMAWGCTHLMNTSLPLGGEDSNAVFAGHTGYFGMIVFDYIPNLNIGDIVSVTTYFDKLDYRVISKKEITDTYTNDIYIEKGKDLLTLITCASRGKARYEVVCERS